MNTNQRPVLVFFHVPQRFILMTADQVAKRFDKESLEDFPSLEFKSAFRFYRLQYQKGNTNINDMYDMLTSMQFEDTAYEVDPDVDVFVLKP